MFQPEKNLGMVFPLRYRLYRPEGPARDKLNGSRAENKAGTVYRHAAVFSLGGLHRGGLVS